VKAVSEKEKELRFGILREVHLQLDADGESDERAGAAAVVEAQGDMMQVTRHTSPAMRNSGHELHRHSAVGVVDPYFAQLRAREEAVGSGSGSGCNAPARCSAAPATAGAPDR
jgi:hypothetical protein